MNISTPGFLQKNNEMKFLLCIFLIILLGQPLQAQSEKSNIRQGNREYRQENYTDAERNYRKALEEDPQNTTAMYNLANTLYRQGRYEEASDILEGLTHLEVDEDRKADVYHNLGNANLNLQQIKEGVDAYKNALRIRPEDMDTRHNLAYAMQLLEEQEQQQQDQGDDDQEGEDQREQDQEPGDDQQDQGQDQEQQQEQPQEPQQDEEQQPTQPQEISPEDARRILDALNQQEQEVQQKIEREQKEAQPRQQEKEW